MGTYSTWGFMASSFLVICSMEVTCTVMDGERVLLSVILPVSDSWQAEQVKEQFLADPALLYRSNLAVLTGDANMRRAGTELVIKL